MKEFCDHCEDKTKHENDKCLESESGHEDEYRELYCDYCDRETRMTRIPEINNFICQSCERLLLKMCDFKIVESFDDDGDLELFVTKNMFIYLVSHDYLDSLMRIYEDRIYICKPRKPITSKNNSRPPFGLPQTLT